MRYKALVMVSVLALLTVPAIAQTSNSSAKKTQPKVIRRGRALPPSVQPVLQVAPEAVEQPAAQKPATPPVASDILLIQESKPYVARTNTAQRFVDYINFGPGQEKLPLTLTFRNGKVEDDEQVAPRYAWIRASVGGSSVLADNEFASKGTVAIDLTGKVGAGADQIIIEVGGIAGSTLSWTVTAPKVVLTSSKPEEVAPGDKLTLNGANFSTNAVDNIVNFGDKQAQVISATDSKLQIKVPDDAQTGKVTVSVLLCGMQSQPIQVKVKAVPELESTSWMEGPPGLEVEITGKNFGKNLSDNKVFFAEYQAYVSAATPTKLTVIVPEMPNPYYDAPVTVQVAGVKSKNSLKFQVYNRVF